MLAAEHDHEEEDEEEPELTPQEMSALRRQFARGGMPQGMGEDEEDEEEDEDYEFGMPGGDLRGAVSVHSLLVCGGVEASCLWLAPACAAWPVPTASPAPIAWVRHL